MNTTDSEKYKNSFETMKNIKIEQKCFNKAHKLEEKFSLMKNKGKNI